MNCFKNVSRQLFLLAILFLGFHTSSQAQSAKIEGQVTDLKQKPISNINVALQGTQYGAASDRQGGYTIQNIPAGDYILLVSGVGYTNQRKAISIRKGELLSVNITLSKSDEQLQEIIVQDKQINRFSVELTDYVAKVPVKNLNNPQVYNTVTSDLLDEQLVTNFEDALKNAPGVFKLWESTGRGGDGAGYYSLRGFASQPNMVNGLPALTNGSPDPVNIERVEIIKGPSGTLFGSSLISYGGLINVVTKKPYNVFGGEVGFKTGSYGLNRITADINTPISNEEDIALRVTGAYHKNNSFQNAGFNESFFVAPSLSYKVNDRLEFLVNTEYYTSEKTNPTMLFLSRGNELNATNLNELGYDNEESFTSNGISINNPTFSMQGQMRYEISDSWTSQTAISSSSAKSEGIYTYLYSFSTPNQTFGRYANNQNSTTLGTDIQQNFIGNFDVAGTTHKMVLGLDYFHENVINNSSGYVLVDQVSLQESNEAISRPAVDSALVSAPINKTKTKQQVYSAYASDVIEIHPMLSAMVSLRVDHFKNEGNTSSEDDDYKQTTLSPKFGVIFKPIGETLSLFANYMNGFSNVAPRVQDDGSTKSFSAEQANQWEAGIKSSLMDGRLSGSLSYYDIRVSNVVRQDPERVNFYVQDGTNYSRGIEASLTASPVSGLDIIAGYSYNKSEITKTGNSVYLGRRPESAGPQTLVNGWVNYRFQKGPIKGVGLGFGGNYASENLILNRENTGQFALPSFTVLNASVSYSTDSYRLDLKVNNLSDEEYYKGWTTVNPQQPRIITAGFSYKF